MPKRKGQEPASFPEWSTDWPRTAYEMLDFPVPPSTQTSSVPGAVAEGKTEEEAEAIAQKRRELEAERKQWIAQRDAQFLEAYFGSSPSTPTEALERDIPAPQVRLICAEKDSAVEWYDPIQMGREIRAYDDFLGKEQVQPHKPEGRGEWPPHRALTRLDMSLPPDRLEKAVIRFCGDYGLLGLRKIPSWKDRPPWPVVDPELTAGPDSHSRWYDHPSPEPKPHWDALPENDAELQERVRLYHAWHIRTFYEQRHPWQVGTPRERHRAWQIRTYREPVDLFLEAAQEYQQVFALLEQLKDAPVKRPKPSGRNGEAEAGSHDTPVTRSEIETEIRTVMDPYLRGCTFHPVRQEGRWILGAQFRSLLEACYFRLMLDMTEKAGAIRRCADPKCDRFFFAPPGHLYCCRQHQVRASVDKCGDRQVKAWLRGLQREGRISKDELDAARKEVDRLYDKQPQELYDRENPKGIRDKDALQKRIEVFLDQHRKAKEGV